MAIDTTKPISSVTYNGTEIPLVGGDEPVYDTPTIEVSSGGLITASANGKSATQQLSTQAAKSVTPNTTTQTAVASGKYTTGAVTVNPIPSDYIIPSGNLDITENGEKTVTQYQTVTVNVPTPTPSYDTPSIEVSTGGLITASANGKSSTKQLTTKSGTTITPSSSQQTAISSQTFATGNILVSAVPTETKSAVTPTKSSQTINATSGKYMTSLTVNAIPSQYIIPSGSETKTANGTYDVTSLAELIVNVSGGGGLPTGISALDFGSITVSSDFTTSRQTFSHKLGVTPDLMIVWATANVATTYSMLAAIRGSQFGWRSSAYNNHMAYHGNSTTSVTWTNSNSTTYGISNMTATQFQLASASSSYYWRKGTYSYIAIKFG